VLQLKYWASYLLSKFRHALCTCRFSHLPGWQGRVVENGTHSALLSKGGKYATMWSRQANVDDASALELFDDNQHSKQE